MTYFTLDEIKTKLKYDQDIFDEDFVDLDTELLGYINEAVDDAESIIHTLYEDYFLCQSTITLISGTSEYSLPSDIYGHKVRGFLYDNGSTYYPIKKLRKLSDSLNYRSGSTESYRYAITNSGTSGPKVKFWPTPLESGTNITVWYIRNAKRLSAGTDQCDIPEFINFIYAHVKLSLGIKEKLQMDIELAKERVLTMKSLMEKTLSNMVIDEDADRIELDTSFYDDFDREERIL